MLPTEYRQSPVMFIQYTCRRVRVNEDGFLEKSAAVTKFLVGIFIIFMETTGVDASWINRNNEGNNRIIHNMVGAGFIDMNQHEKNGVSQQKHQLKYIGENTQCII